MIEDRIKSYESELVAIRHDLHEHPELAFEEVRTSDVVAAKLTEWGFKVHRGLAKTGVVATMTNGGGNRSIGIRADMDALPIHEETGKGYSPKPPARCMPAATTATRRCCSAPPATSPRRRTSPAPCTSSSNRPRRTSAARAS